MSEIIAYIDQKFGEQNMRNQLHANDILHLVQDIWKMVTIVGEPSAKQQYPFDKTFHMQINC